MRWAHLAGMDVGRLLRAAHKDPKLAIPAFLASGEVAFKAVVPATDKFLLGMLYRSTRGVDLR